MSPPEVSSDLAFLVGATLIVYVIGMYALSFWAQGKIENEEDFLVAGRRLPVSLASATILATWFGAGTMLTAADEVRAEGLRKAALDPLGAGFCLLLAGAIFAKPLWRMGLLTVSDFFRRKFGPRAELLSALIMVPSYFGWIAAQFIALAGMLHLFFGLDMTIGIFLVAVVGTGYTFLGGMWSVTLTDALQISLVLIGLVALAFSTLSTLGNEDVMAGLIRLGAETPSEYLQLIPHDTTNQLLGWLGVFAIGALGNIPGQDLLQRVFSSKSPEVARRACFVAGGAYLTFGAVPVMLGLASRLLFPDELQRAILPALAHSFLSPTMTVIFTVALASAVISTIDSAILSPSSVLAQNVLPRFSSSVNPLLANRMAVVVVALASLVFAYLGEDAYALLEDAYALPLTGLFVPLCFAMARTPRREAAGLAAMLVGPGVWLVHYFAGWGHFLAPVMSLELPIALTCAVISAAAYLAFDR